MIQELPCTLSLKEIKFLMIQLEVLLVVTHLVDEYQTTAQAGMCREQYEQGLSNTIDSKDGGLVHQLTFGGSLGSSRRIGTSCRLHHLVHFPYHHRQCHAMRIFPLFILNSRACTEVNNSFAGLLIVNIVVDSYALHAPYIFLWKVCVE